MLRFDDIEPEAPVHTLIVPKTHYDNLAAGVPAEVIGHMMSVVPEVARLKGVGESGYRTVVNTGPDSAATVKSPAHSRARGTKMGRFPSRAPTARHSRKNSRKRACAEERFC